jgi:hypothetical protein
MNKTAIAIIAALAVVPVAANAGEVQNRINHEQARINQGVTGHDLTYGQYHRLDNSLDRIQAERNRDLRRDGGHLTAGQYRSLNGQENNLSDRIYWDKHT